MMITAIGDILKSKIEVLNFADRVAGIVQTLLTKHNFTVGVFVLVPYASQMLKKHTKK